MKSWDLLYKKNIEKKWKQDKLQEDMPKLLKIFRKNKVEKILDLGCGAGRNLVFFASRGFDVWGIDYSVEGLKKTKKKLREIGASAKLRRGDIFEKLPYKTNFFDAVICVQVINHNRLPIIRKSFREIERILKKKGFLYISVMRDSPSARLFMETHKEYMHKKIAPRTYLPLGGPEKGVVHYIFRKSDVLRILKNYRILKFGTNKPKYHWLVLAKKL